MENTDLTPINFRYEDEKVVFSFHAERCVIPFFCGASLMFNHRVKWVGDLPSPEKQYDIYSLLYQEIVNTALRYLDEDYDDDEDGFWEEEEEYMELGNEEDIPEIAFSGVHKEFYRIMQCMGFEQFTQWRNGNSGNLVTGFKVGLQADLDAQHLPFNDSAWGNKGVE